MKIEVAFDDASDEYISAWATREHGPRLPIESSGTGVLQAIQVLAYVGLYEPRLLILDEPDAHLHPDNQRKLARLLVSLAAERTFQVLISTHSRHMLDELGQHNSIVQWMSAGEFRDGDFDRVAALLELGALDAGDRLRNGDTSTVLITEDSDTEYLRALALSSDLPKANLISGLTLVRARLRLLLRSPVSSQSTLLALGSLSTATATTSTMIKSLILRLLS